MSDSFFLGLGSIVKNLGNALYLWMIKFSPRYSIPLAISIIGLIPCILICSMRDPHDNSDLDDIFAYVSITIVLSGFIIAFCVLIADLLSGRLNDDDSNDDAPPAP